jgi:hypothetical protein
MITIALAERLTSTGRQYLSNAKERSKMNINVDDLVLNKYIFPYRLTISCKAMCASCCKKNCTVAVTWVLLALEITLQE